MNYKAMLSTLKTKVSALDSAPLITFLITYKVTKSWDPAFKIAGTIAFFWVLFELILLKEKFSRAFLLAINLFLIGGAAMLFLNIEWLQHFYAYFMHATLFACITLVGIIATIIAPKSFIHIKNINLCRARMLSGIMILASIIATGLSLYFKGNFMFAAYVPFFFILFIREFLESYNEWSQKTISNIVLQNTVILGISLLLKNTLAQAGLLSFILLLIIKRLIKKYKFRSIW